MDGELWLRSEPGQGSVFGFSLQLQEAMASDVMRARAQQVTGLAEVEKEKPTVPATELSAGMLERLPAGLRESLNEATRRLDMEEAVEVIARVRGIDAGTADGLQALVDEYRFDRIQELLGTG